MNVKLDFTSDSCVVLVQVDEEAHEALGGSVCGSMFERVDEVYYAMVGEPWDDTLPDLDNDIYHDEMRAAVETELDAAGVDWEEV